MSTWLYLRCDAHTPPLLSDDVGQHLSDLPDIRRRIKARKELVDAIVNYDMTPSSHFMGSAVLFLSQHPGCPLSIVDEYGQEHSTEGDAA